MVAGGALLVLVLVRLLLGWLERKRRVSSFVRHSVLVGLTVVALVAVVLTLKDPVRDQVLKFLGVLFSAVLAFSSTTLVGNGLAGVMLRAQRHFRGGDWLERRRPTSARSPIGACSSPPCRTSPGTS